MHLYSVLSSWCILTFTLLWLQMEQTTSVQEQLLAHVLGDKDLEVYSLMSSLVAAEDNTPASTESSRSNSPTDG